MEKILFALGMLAVLVAYLAAVLTDRGDRLRRSPVGRRLLAMTAFAIASLVLVVFSTVVTHGIAGAGRNAIEIEDGRRVAHFGVQFRFATSNVDESPYRDAYAPLGTDAWWNPMEVPTEFDDTALERSMAVIFGLLSLFTLVPWAIARDVRALRRRTA